MTDLGLLTYVRPGINDLAMPRAPKSETYPEVAAFMKRVRAMARKTQEQVATNAGIGVQTVRDAEAGRNPTYSTLTSIAIELGYKNALAMIQSPEFKPDDDQQTRRLLEFWALLKGDLKARKDALATMALKAASVGTSSAKVRGE